MGSGHALRYDMQALLVLDKSHAYGRNPGLASLTWQCNGAVAALKILRNSGAMQVFKAQWNGTEAAVKMEFLHEPTILKALQHPNVVEYFGLAFSEKDEVRSGSSCSVAGDQPPH